MSGPGTQGRRLGPLRPDPKAPGLAPARRDGGAAMDTNSSTSSVWPRHAGTAARRPLGPGRQARLAPARRDGGFTPDDAVLHCSVWPRHAGTAGFRHLLDTDVVSLAPARRDGGTPQAAAKPAYGSGPG